MIKIYPFNNIKNSYIKTRNVLYNKAKLPLKSLIALSTAGLLASAASGCAKEHEEEIKPNEPNVNIVIEEPQNEYHFNINV